MPIKKYMMHVDGKDHQVSESNIEKYGIDAYAKYYPGATIRMRDAQNEDYDIPLVDYQRALGIGLRPFVTSYYKDEEEEITERSTFKPDSVAYMPEKPVAAAEKPVVAAEKPVVAAEKPVAVADSVAAAPETPKPKAEVPVNVPENAVNAADSVVNVPEKPVNVPDSVVNVSENPTGSASDVPTSVADTTGVRKPEEPSVSTGYDYKPEVQEHIAKNIPGMFKSDGKSLMDKPLSVGAGVAEADWEGKKYGARFEAVVNYYNSDTFEKRQKKEVGDHLKALSGDVAKSLEETHERMRARVPQGGNAANALMRTGQYNRDNAGERKEAGRLNAAKSLIEDSENIVRESGLKDKSGFFGGLGRGFKDVVFDPETWTMGLAEMANGKYLYDAVEKADKGEKLTPSEEKLLDSAVTNMAVNAYYGSDVGMGYKAGEMTGASIPFMLEFAVNPVSASGSGIAKSILNYGMKKLGRGISETVVAKAGARLVGDAIAAGGVTATTGLGGVGSGVVDRMTGRVKFGIDRDGQLTYQGREGQKGLGEAVAKSVATNVLERQSEMIFNAFKGAGGALWGAVSDHLPDGVTDFMKMASRSKVGKLYNEMKNNPILREVAQRTQFHGLPEEYMEEVYNNFANVALGEMTMEQATDLQQNIEIMLGLAPTSVFFGVLGGASLAYEKAKNRQAMQNKDEAQQKLFEELKRDSARNDGVLKDFVADVVADEQMEPEAKKDAFDTASRVAADNAVDDMTVEIEVSEETSREAVSGPVSATRILSDKEGARLYAEHDPARMRQAVVRQQVSRQRMSDALVNPVEVDALSDADDAAREAFLAGLDANQRRLAEDYLAQVDLVDGMNDAMNTAHTPEVEAAEALTQKMTSPNGKVVVVALGKHSDEEHEYGVVVSGVDASGNPTSPEGQIIVVPVKSQNWTPDYSTFDESRALSMRIEDAKGDVSVLEPDTVTEGMLGNYNADIGLLDMPAIEAGMNVMIADEEGNTANVQVVSPSLGGGWLVLEEGQREPIEMSEDELNQMRSNAEKLPILAEYAEADKAYEREQRELQRQAERAEQKAREAEEASRIAEEMKKPVNRLAKHPDGKPDYENSRPEDVREYLLESLGLDGAVKSIRSQRADLERQVAEQEAKIETLISESEENDYFPDEAIRVHGLIQQEQDKLYNIRKKLDFWKGVERMTAGPTEAEAQKTVTRSVAQQKAAKTKRETYKPSDEYRKMQQAMAESEVALDVLNDLEPHTPEELAAQLISGGVRLMKGDETVGDTVLKGVQSMTGYRGKDLQRMNFIFATRANGGVSVGEFGEMLESAAQEAGVRFGGTVQEEGVNALLSLLGDVETMGDINRYVERNRMREASMLFEEEQAAIHDAMDKAAWEEYHMSYEDYKKLKQAITDFLEIRQRFTQEFWKSDEYIDFITNFAENITDNGQEGNDISGSGSGIDETGKDDGRGNEVSSGGNQEPTGGLQTAAVVAAERKQVAEAGGSGTENRQSDDVGDGSSVPDGQGNRIVEEYQRVIDDVYTRMPFHAETVFATSEADIDRFSGGLFGEDVLAEIKDCLNDKTTVAFFDKSMGLIFVFPHKHKSAKELVKSLWHENAHYFIERSPIPDKDVKNQAALEVLRTNFKDAYEYILRNYDPKDVPGEAFPTLVEKLYDKFGEDKLRKANVPGNADADFLLYNFINFIDNGFGSLYGRSQRSDENQGGLGTVREASGNTGEIQQADGRSREAEPVSSVRERGSDGAGEGSGMAGQPELLSGNEGTESEAGGGTEVVPYSIEPAQYTTKKGKVLDMYLVKFDPERFKNFLSWDVVKKEASELRGWKDRNMGGYLMRSREDAERLAEFAVMRAETDAADMESLRKEIAEKQEKELKPTYDEQGRETIESQARHSESEAERLASETESGSLEDAAATGRGRGTGGNRPAEGGSGSGRPQAVNGYRIGETVLYKGKEATIFDFENDGTPVLDTGMSPVIYEVGYWENIQKMPTTTEQVNRIAEAHKPKKKLERAEQRQKRNQPKREKQKEQMSDLFAQADAQEEKLVRQEQEIDAQLALLGEYKAGPKAQVREDMHTGAAKTLEKAGRKFAKSLASKLGGHVDGKELSRGITNIAPIGGDMVFRVWMDDAETQGVMMLINFEAAPDTDAFDKLVPKYGFWRMVSDKDISGVRNSNHNFSIDNVKELESGAFMTKVADDMLSEIARDARKAGQARTDEPNNEPNDETNNVVLTEKETKNDERRNGQADSGTSGTNERAVPDGRTTGNQSENPELGTEARQEAERTERGRDGGSVHGNNVLDTTGSGRVSERDGEQQPSVDSKIPKTIQRNANNFSFGETHLELPSGEIGKLKGNIEAIRTLKELEASGQPATPAQKQALLKFVGWGGLAEALNTAEYDLWQAKQESNRRWGWSEAMSATAWSKKWGKHYEELRPLMTDEEWAQAQASTLNSHYTPEAVIRSLWEALEYMGFEGGKVLEPAMGVGHIVGFMPKSISERSIISGFELDGLPGRIAKQLYPDANITVGGYETAFRPSSKDAVVTNVPFGQTAPVDPALDKTLRRKIGIAYNLHNYFIIKGLLELKPGGVGAFVTSSATMDGRSGKAREYIAGMGVDLIGAIRLPNNAFKSNAGTEVTADILFFRKRLPGEQSNGVGFGSLKQVGTGTYKGKDKKGKETLLEVPLLVNEYFADRPEMMLGTVMTAHDAGTGGLYGGDSQTLAPKPGAELSAELADAIGRLPENALSAGTSEQVQAASGKESTTLKDGTLTVKDGKVYVANKEELTEVAKGSFKHGGKTRSYADATKDYLELKETLKELIKAEQTQQEDPVELRQKLDGMYDRFVEKYGHLNNNKALDAVLEEDVEHFLPQALEKVTTTVNPATGRRTKTVSKGDGILVKRVSQPMTEPSTAESLNDAIGISQAYRGRMDVDYIASMLGMTSDEARERILAEREAYEDPVTGDLIDRDAYLSGNIREKLETARAAAETDSRYEQNVSDLESAMPESIPFVDISYKMGTPWIPADVYESFGEEVVGIKNMKVSYVPAIDEFVVNGGYIDDYQKSGDFTTTRRDAMALFEDAINLRKPTITKKVKAGGEERTVKDEAATQEAISAIMDMNDAFIRYVQEKSDIHTRLQNVYNDRYNNYRLREYREPNFRGADGKVHYPGSNGEIDLRTHQVKAVQRSLQGSTLLAHQVGTGKTFTMITTAMEMRRLGIAKKPMIVVQNATLQDFAADFIKLYPGANILVPNEKERSASQRKRLFNLIATGDFDAIIIPQSFLAFIPDNEWRKRALIQARVDEIMAAAEAMEEVDRNLANRLKKEAENMQFSMIGGEEGKGKKKSVKKEAKKEESALVRETRKLDRRTDDVMTFEQMGVDALFIDEAHNFKKIGFATKMQNVKGVDTGFSERANSLYLKASYVQEKNGGRNVILATGTPITNTMAEVWTMMRFVAPEILEDYQIRTFDEFAATFGQVEPSLEQNSTGGFKVADRFKSYVNVPELIKAFRSHADVVLTSDVPEFKESKSIPKLKDDKMTNHVIKKSRKLEEVMDVLISALAEDEKKTGKDKTPGLPLVVFSKAKQAAIDLRLINPEYPDDPDSKTNKVVSEVMRIYKESTPDKGIQMIFCDSYQSPSGKPAIDLFDYDPDVPQFNLYRDIKQKLVDAGIPKEEIVIVSEISNADRKKAVFEKARNGDVRVLIGGTEKMGVGVNVQDRMIALHHMDAPIRPMDFEQRNGRILRQGNMFAEMEKPVEVLTYGVEGTLDATAYERLRIKQDFINQMMKGDVSGRVMEESDDEDPSGKTFSQMAAELSGDKTLQMLFVAESRVKKLEGLRRSHELKRKNAETEKAFIKTSLAAQKKKLKEAEAVGEKVAKLFPEGITKLTINGRPVTEKLSKTLSEMLEDYEGRYALNRSVVFPRVELNDKAGLLVFGHDSGQLVYTLYVDKAMLAEAKPVNSYAGVWLSVNSALGNTGKRAAEIKQDIANLEAKLKGAESMSVKDFDKMDELTEVRKEVRKLKEELAKKAENPVPTEESVKLAKKNLKSGEKPVSLPEEAAGDSEESLDRMETAMRPFEEVAVNAPDMVVATGASDILKAMPGIGTLQFASIVKEASRKEVQAMYVPWTRQIIMLPKHGTVKEMRDKRWHESFHFGIDMIIPKGDEGRLMLERAASEADKLAPGLTKWVEDTYGTRNVSEEKVVHVLEDVVSYMEDAGRVKSLLGGLDFGSRFPVLNDVANRIINYLTNNGYGKESDDYRGYDEGNQPQGGRENQVGENDEELAAVRGSESEGREEIKSFLKTGTPVSKLTGKEFVKKEGQTFVEQVTSFFEEQGGKADSAFGEVLLDHKGVKNSKNHGMSRIKAAAFASVKDVLENGAVALPMGYYGTGNKKQLTGVIVAPIEIDKERYYCAVEVIRNTENNRLYVHEAFAEEKFPDSVAASQVHAGESGSLQNQGEIAKLLQNILTDNISGEESRSKVEPQGGRENQVGENDEEFATVRGSETTKAERIEKLRNSRPIVAEWKDYEGRYELNKDSAEKYILYNLRGDYTNKDTGEKIKISRKSVKVMHHDVEDEVHLKSVALIPEMLEESIFIEEVKNEKDSGKFDSYRYYVVGLKLDGVDYTAKLVVGVKGGDVYYDHALTEIEKSDILNQIDLVNAQVYDDNTALSDVKDKRLISILQTNPQENEGFKFSLREKPAPKKTGIGYKVFVVKDGKLYPPMVANPGGQDTPVGVWLDADAAPVAGESKTGRLKVKAGGKGTQGGSGTLAYRPGWHLGEIPYALQFNRKNPETGERELFPSNFVWAEVEYANDRDYQDEAMSYGMNASGKFQHSLAGLPRVPEDGAYRYRTNPNPETDPWVISGAMKVNRILTPSEVDAMVVAAGREPQQRQAGALTDADIDALNRDLLSEIKFGLRGQPRRKAGESLITYHRRVKEWEREMEEAKKRRDVENMDVENPLDTELNDLVMEVMNHPSPIRKRGESDEDFNARQAEWSEWYNKRRPEVERRIAEIKVLLTDEKHAARVKEMKRVDEHLYDGTIPEQKDDEGQLSDEEMREVREIFQEKMQDAKIAIDRDQMKRDIKQEIIERRRYIETSNLEDTFFVERLKKVAKSKEVLRAIPDYIERTYTGEETPELKEAAKMVSDWFEEVYNLMAKEGVLYDAPKIQDYVTHIWDKKRSPKEALERYENWVNTMRLRSPFTKHRVIPSYREGIAMGLVPKYEDITGIIQEYGHYATETIANKRMVDFLRNFKVFVPGSEDNMPMYVDLIVDDKVKDPIYQRMNHTALDGYKVVSEYHKYLKPVFGDQRILDHKQINNWVNKLLEGIWVTSSTIKKVALSFSFFHHFALLETGISMMRPWHAAKVIGKNMIWDVIMKGDIPAMHDEEATRDAVKHLVSLGATNDYAASDVSNFTAKARKWAKDKDIVGLKNVTKWVDCLNRGFDKVLWDTIHDGFKIASFTKMAKEVRARAEREGWSNEDLEKALDECGHLVNDTFGGLHFDILGFSPKEVRIMRALLLSPDWTFATIRQALSPFGFGKLYGDEGFWKTMFGGENPVKMRKKYGRAFWVTAALFFYAMFNALNAWMRIQDEDEWKKIAEEKRKIDPSYKSPYELAYPDGMKWYDYTMLGNTLGHQTHLFTGRYEDGTERYLRWGKQFRELPELFFNRDGFSIPYPMIEKIAGKANPLLNTFFTVISGHSLSGWENEHMKGTKEWDRTVGASLVIRDAFIPYSIPTQEDKDWYVLDLIMPSSKGFSQGKAINYFEKGIKSADMEYIRDVYNACVMNGLNPEKSFDVAKARFEAEGRANMLSGVDNVQDALLLFGNTTDVQKRKRLVRYIEQQIGAQDFNAISQEEMLLKAKDVISGEAKSTDGQDAYLEHATSEDVMEDYRLKKNAAGLRKYYQDYSELVTSQPEAGQRMLEEKRKYIEGYALTTKTRTAISRIKKAMKDGRVGGDEGMNEIRRLRSEYFKRMDEME